MKNSLHLRNGKGIHTFVEIGREVSMDDDVRQILERIQEEKRGQRGAKQQFHRAAPPLQMK